MFGHFINESLLGSFSSVGYLAGGGDVINKVDLIEM